MNETVAGFFILGIVVLAYGMGIDTGRRMNKKAATLARCDCYEVGARPEGAETDRVDVCCLCGGYVA